jgi:hypothetical protein
MAGRMYRKKVLNEKSKRFKTDKYWDIVYLLSTVNKSNINMQILSLLIMFILQLFLILIIRLFDSCESK